MLKAKLVGGGQPVILLGLEAENVKRLKEGKPILVLGADLGIDFDIYIVYGKTVKEIAAEHGLPGVH
jgi:hypothetical protein